MGRGILSRLFGRLGRIKLPKFRIPFRRKKSGRTTYKYKIKKDGGWNLKKFPGMPKSPNVRGWYVRVKQKSKGRKRSRK